MTTPEHPAVQAAFRAAGAALALDWNDEDEVDAFTWHPCDTCANPGPCGCAGIPFPGPIVQAAILAAWDTAVTYGCNLSAEAIEGDPGEPIYLNRLDGSHQHDDPMLARSRAAQIAREAAPR